MIKNLELDLRVTSAAYYILKLNIDDYQIYKEFLSSTRLLFLLI